MKNIEIKNNTKCNVECQVIDDTTTRIVINDEYVPKDGDFVRTKNGSVFIFKKTGYNGECRRYASFGYGYLSIGGEDVYHCGYMNTIDGPATPAEIQLLTDKLKEQGKRWNANKKVVEEIPTFKVGDWFIPHKPWRKSGDLYWNDKMDKLDGTKLQITDFDEKDLMYNEWSFAPSWCEKVEAPKPEPKAGEMCIFWDNDKKCAQCAILGEIINDGGYAYEKETGTRWKNCVLFESVEQYKKIISNE